MYKIHSTRNGCVDVFNAFLVDGSIYDGDLEIPIINPEYNLPNKLIPFSKAVGSKQFDFWVHFYEDDVKFERIWENPRKYLPILQKFNGVITPDFSLYRDMPLVMQQWNTYRARAIGHFLQKNGVAVIPNVRFGDERSFRFCCLGVPKNATIAIGSHGCIQSKVERQFFKQGLEYVLNELNPQNVIVYGMNPPDIFKNYIDAGINIIQFDSEILMCRKVAKY